LPVPFEPPHEHGQRTKTKEAGNARFRNRSSTNPELGIAIEFFQGRRTVSIINNIIEIATTVAGTRGKSPDQAGTLCLPGEAQTKTIDRVSLDRDRRVKLECDITR